MKDLHLVYVEKDGDLRTHIGKAAWVQWTGGKETRETVPACGAKVDVAALHPYVGSPTEVTCLRCQRTGLYAAATR
jgi:hypothetical protein